MSIIEDVFKPIIGTPAWNVCRGVGTTLTFEFGDPHLVIREPRKVKSSSSLKVRRHLARRSIQVRGAWHLWITWCEWEAYHSERLIGSHSSPTRIINNVAREFDGQVLISVTVQQPSLTTFEFDLGGKLVTMPGMRDEEISEMNDQWSLFALGGKVLTLRDDGNYCYKSGKEVIYPGDWIPIFSRDD